MTISIKKLTALTNTKYDNDNVDDVLKITDICNDKVQ